MDTTSSSGVGEGVGESVIRRGALRGDSQVLVDVLKTESSFLLQEPILVCV